MTVVAAEAAGGAAAAGGGGATAGRAAAGGVGGQTAGGGPATGVPYGPPGTARRPASGARGKQGTRGPAGKSGSASKSGAGMFEKTGQAGQNIEHAVDAGLNEGRRITLTPPKRLTVGDGAGFLAGLLGYVLFLNYLRYGREGVKGWLGAKFVNRPWFPPDDSGDGGQGVGDRKANA